MNALLAAGGPFPRRGAALVLLLALLVLAGAAALRSTEHDEIYSIFVTGGIARPDWPRAVFTPDEVAEPFLVRTGPAETARLLRVTDVHPPLYFWTLGFWRSLAGDSLLGLRALSVLLSLGTVLAWMAAAWRSGLPPLAVGLSATLAYGFAYTGHIARGFALAHLLIVLTVLAALEVWRRQEPRPDPPSRTFPGTSRTAGPIPAPRASREGAFRNASPDASLNAASAVPSSALPAPGRTPPPATASGAPLANPLATPSATPPAAPPSAPGGRSGPMVWAAAAGLAGGLACFTNYLAVFPAAAVLAWMTLIAPRDWSRRVRTGLVAALPFLVMLAATVYFFVAQKDSRGGQFQPFELAASVARLARFNAANVFGGLPLYLPGFGGTLVGAALAALLLAVAAAIALAWRRVGPTLWLWAAGAVAPSLGVLALGAVFGNTPIELRYIAFAAPFAAALIGGGAGAWARTRPGLAAAGLALVLAVEAAGIVGMLLHPATQQPFRNAIAAVADRLGSGSVLLVPFAEDGVGVTGSLILEAPRGQSMLALRSDDAAQAPQRAAGYRRAVVIGLGDRSGAVQGRAAADALAADPSWRALGQVWSDYRGGFADAFERRDPGG